MSSTNRKNAKERHVSDYYVTPQKDIRDFFQAWLTDMADEEDFLSLARQSRNLIFLDPCAGGDVNHTMSYPEVLKEVVGDGEGVIDTMDIREDSLADMKSDFLIADIQQQYDVVITNPPFNLAQEIIERAHDVVQTGGYVVMLLRLNFLGSKARKAFWEKYPPQRIYVHHRRMSFTDDGATDSIEYAHFVWQKGTSPKEALLRII